MYRVGSTNRCIPILNAEARSLLLVTFAKTKSYQKNRMLRSRESHELERVLFPCNRLLQPITRAISILRRVVLPQFLGISRDCNCTCKDCAHSNSTYRTYIRYTLYYILSWLLQLLQHTLWNKGRERIFSLSSSV